MNVSRTARSAMKCSPQVGLDFGTGMKWFKLGDGFQSNFERVKKTHDFCTVKKCEHHFSINKY
jgi:hypothetical protein